MRELSYETATDRYPPRRKGYRARQTAKKRRAEGPVIKAVRAACVERDGYCRVAHDHDVPLLFECSGPSEWAHLENHRRGRTRNMKPELRHTTAGTAMLCRRHHRKYDAGTLRIVKFTGKGADGPIQWKTVG